MAIDSRLFMEIGFKDDEFQAIDKTPYERWINEGHFDNDHEHLILQRLLLTDDIDHPITIGDISIKATNNLDELRDVFVRPDQTSGLYYYQKMLIPSEDHGSQGNEILYFDSEYKVHFVDTDTEKEVILDPEKSFDEIYDILRETYPDNCFYFDDYAFSIYDLVRCYILTEREIINNYLRNHCRDNCNMNENVSLKADMLLAAITVIQNLLEKQDYFEAQRILNGLNTCKGLCDKFINNLKGCGCGRA